MQYLTRQELLFSLRTDSFIYMRMAERKVIAGNRAIVLICGHPDLSVTLFEDYWDVDYHALSEYDGWFLIRRIHENNIDVCPVEYPACSILQIHVSDVCCGVVLSASNNIGTALVAPGVIALFNYNGQYINYRAGDMVVLRITNIQSSKISAKILISHMDHHSQHTVSFGRRAILPDESFSYDFSFAQWISFDIRKLVPVSDLTEDFLKARDNYDLIYDQYLYYFPLTRHVDGIIENIPLFSGFDVDYSKGFAEIKNIGLYSRDLRRILQNHVFCDSWNTMFHLLFEMCEKEYWGDHPLLNHPVLRKHIAYVYYLSYYSGKIIPVYANNTLYYVFSTGLISKCGNEIFAVLKDGKFANKKFYLAGFTDGTVDALAHPLEKVFCGTRPKSVTEHLREHVVTFDPSLTVIPDYRHIIVDNILRLPKEFLLKNCEDPNLTVLIHDAFNADYDGNSLVLLQKYLLKLFDYNDENIERLTNMLSEAINHAIDSAMHDSNLAHPVYYLRTNSLSYVLPLCLQSENQADCALVLEQKDSAYYGITVLTIDMAYQNARLLGKVDSSWLRLDEKDVEEEFAGILSDTFDIDKILRYKINTKPFSAMQGIEVVVNAERFLLQALNDYVRDDAEKCDFVLWLLKDIANNISVSRIKEGLALLCHTISGDYEPSGLRAFRAYTENIRLMAFSLTSIAISALY